MIPQTNQKIFLLWLTYLQSFIKREQRFFLKKNIYKSYHFTNRQTIYKIVELKLRPHSFGQLKLEVIIKLPVRWTWVWKKRNFISQVQINYKIIVSCRSTLMLLYIIHPSDIDVIYIGCQILTSHYHNVCEIYLLRQK